ncbi:glyoxylase-like metal-dependent hydrolase (beta-lactamase superfamily II) [Saccharothrix tamanrassetensis]|uniref:Glyoxylase-like metal-dependent hydrolase (Beta-lactamase superfamily II) n=1 Tax=Saccharothrix tamanrassetensis TaxID=1051531 RepID=A0A841CJZ2_9PSEU|nr:MBL fold metallo-hydrolase [Saccharothrix tamanrassetensis]MBB5956488.1 glyoxylase-like metal-dependent hydrolase (beta-lactamase superfamily II) [Saccharothrix tamanrassetensis]
MKVHHLNCGTMRPFSGKLVDGRASVLRRAELVCHCLLVETDDELVLVDTGMGLHDVRDPAATLPSRFRRLCQPVLSETETAWHQVRQLGHRPEDVRHVVLTHLDVDHAGGVRDFPGAKVHVLAEELADADNPRYSRAQFDGADWAPHEPTGERWFGFDGVRELRPDILLVPLIGHTRGHTGVAVDTGDRWLLHAGDAYFFHGEKDTPPTVTPGLKLMQQKMETIRELRLSNQDRLRELVRDHGDRVDVFCAHDVAELRHHQLHHAG